MVLETASNVIGLVNIASRMCPCQNFSPFQFMSSQIQKLQNVVSGPIVADEFCDDILNAHSIGKQSMNPVMIY